jgi:transposase
VPKSQDGRVEAIRILRLERRSAIHARTQAANQLHAVVSTAPETLREKLRKLSIGALVARVRKLRGTPPSDAASATERVLKGLARRYEQLDQEVQGLDAELESLVKEAASDLLSLRGVGVDVAGTLLVAAGDNPDRLKSEASFAALCGVSPLDASSGRQNRHRLNRGGNRDANRALWVVALVRMRCDPRTRAYAERRTKEGLSKPEILRCLKRYIVREIFKLLGAKITGTPDSGKQTEAA